MCKFMFANLLIANVGETRNSQLTHQVTANKEGETDAAHDMFVDII